MPPEDSLPSLESVAREYREMRPLYRSVESFESSAVAKETRRNQLILTTLPHSRFDVPRINHRS